MGRAATQNKQPASTSGRSVEDLRTEILPELEPELFIFEEASIIETDVFERVPLKPVVLGAVRSG